MNTALPKIESNPERPTNIHAESAVLGCMLVDSEAIYDATEHLSTIDFSLSSHRQIYGAILTLLDEGNPVDIVTVSNTLRTRRELDSVGGIAYLASLSEGLPRKFNIKSYVNIIRDKAMLRDGINLCERYRASLISQEEEAISVFAKMELELMELSSGSKLDRSETIAQIVPRVVDKISQDRANPSREDALGFSYAVAELDKITKGMFPNEYTIILAETGGAKTAWLTQILLTNAVKGVKSKLFSMEMTKEQMIRRMLASLSSLVTAKEIRDPRFMGLSSFEDLKITAERLSRLGVSIDDSRQLPLDQMLSKARVAIQRDGVKLIGVDYLQLMRAPTTYRHMTDTERIEMTTLALRDLAADSKDYGAHVLALSQYSRPSDGSRGKPSNSRAKGSSSLEQSCQCMLHAVREQLEDKSLSNEIEIIIGKSREGKLGTIKCLFDEDHLRFKPLVTQ